MAEFKIGDRVVVKSDRKRYPDWVGFIYRTVQRDGRTLFDVCTPNLFRNGTCDYAMAATTNEPHRIRTCDASELRKEASHG